MEKYINTNLVIVVWHFTTKGEKKYLCFLLIVGSAEGICVVRIYPEELIISLSLPVFTSLCASLYSILSKISNFFSEISVALFSVKSCQSPSLWSRNRGSLLNNFFFQIKWWIDSVGLNSKWLLLLPCPVRAYSLCFLSDTRRSKSSV